MDQNETKPAEWTCSAFEFGEPGSDNEGLIAFWMKPPTAHTRIGIRDATKVAAALNDRKQE
jgi:hypothetical protein